MPSKNLTRIRKAAGLLLLMVSLGLFIAGLLHFVPRDRMLDAQVCLWLGFALSAPSWHELKARAFPFLLILPVVLAGAIIALAIQAFASPAREAVIGLGMLGLFGMIGAVTWWLQKRARSAQ